MNLIEILKAKGVSDELIAAIQEDMKANSIYTASEENLDVRYSKLKNQNDTLKADYENLKNDHETLKQSAGDSAELLKQAGEKDATIVALQKQLADEKWRNRARLCLMQAGADDVGYVLYKLEESMTKDGKERKLNDADDIDGWEDLLKNVQAQIPQHFPKPEKAEEEYQVFSPNQLKNGNGKEPSVTKEKFRGMSYEERLALKQKNENQYRQLAK